MAEGQRMTAADVVAQVRDGRLEDFVREAVVLVARELMEAEISEQIGAALGEVAPERASRIGTDIARGHGRPGSGRSSCSSPGSGRAATSRRFWSRGGGQSRRSWPWCWRPMSTGSRPARSFGWSSSSRAANRMTQPRMNHPRRPRSHLGASEIRPRVRIRVGPTGPRPTAL